MTDIDFGTQPTKPPPDEGAWMWAGDRWLEVVTDTGDGVPAELDLDAEAGDDR